MRVRVDPARCTGHAICFLAAPTLMELDDLGYNITGEVEVAEDLQAAARRATASCPETAITLSEDDG